VLDGTPINRTDEPAGLVQDEPARIRSPNPLSQSAP